MPMLTPNSVHAVQAFKTMNETAMTKAVIEAK